MNIRMDAWEKFLKIKNRRLCKDPGCCPILNCMAFHFSSRDTGKNTLEICADFPDCNDLDCVQYHPLRKTLNVCPRLHECDRWYCRLDHPHERKACLKSDCDCGRTLHRPQQSDKNNMLNLPKEIMVHVLQNLSFEEWLCMSQTCQDMRSMKWLAWSTIKKMFDGDRILRCPFIRRGKLQDSKTYYCIESIDMIWMRLCRLEMCCQVYTHENILSTRCFVFRSIAELQISFKESIVIDECPMIVLPGLKHNSPSVYMMGTIPLIKDYSGGVDVLDSDGVWYPGIIKGVRDKEVLIHYRGWADKWDEWIRKDGCYMAPLHTFTKEWGYDTIKKGDEVDIRRNRKWYPGIVTRKDKDVLRVHSIYHCVEFTVSRDSEDISPRSYHENNGAYKKHNRAGKRVIWSDEKDIQPFLISKHPLSGRLSRVSGEEIKHMTDFFNKNIRECLSG